MLMVEQPKLGIVLEKQVVELSVPQVLIVVLGTVP